MNPTKERRAIDNALDKYHELVDTYPDEQFAKTPPIGGWSYSEVYDHILKSTLAASIALERCTHNNCPPTKQGPNFWGRYLLITGLFPPFKVQVPQEVAAKIAPTKIDKEEAKNLLVKTRRRIDGVSMLISDAPKNARWQHPRLGMLNAAQWFKFIRVHLQHHLKQLDRIQNSFAKNG
ncbi:DinB family protein [Mucilaginibacter sp. 14171R-50]|uniref:DinB family protein n=1 Tax=Mucilaginibacter sp. 14171R-50 TaxID=2703789 RepID=UPI00138BA9C2|nr:DinB family protein [Mucilaginibacter sp. 14171R-50]QHS54490.1 DinB family protein [Mucilaginibacter sp. 14171R-50]